MSIWRHGNGKSACASLWVRLLGGGSCCSGPFGRLRVKPGAISLFPFPSHSTVVSGTVVSTKGLLPSVWSFGEVFGGWCADKRAVS